MTQAEIVTALKVRWILPRCINFFFYVLCFVIYKILILYLFFAHSTTRLTPNATHCSHFFTFLTQVQANVDPAFTCLVWQKLLDQNPNFFYGYALRLRLKDQIVAFNYLIDQHSKMLSQNNQNGSQASVAQANQLVGGLQQQQMNDLKQLQQYYAMQQHAAAEQQNNVMHPQQQQQQAAGSSSSGDGIGQPIIPDLTTDEPLSLDPQSLGSGGIADNSLLTPMIQAAAAQGRTTFFPPTPKNSL